MTPYVGTELELFENARNWKRYWSGFIRPYIGETVLEVGAGLGSNTPLLISHSVKTWHCLEPDPELVSRIQAKISAGALPSYCHAETGTIDSLVPEKTFDTILYIDVLEHIKDDRREIETAERRLKAGGHLVVLAPAHESLFSEFDGAIGHFRRYDKNSLRRVAQTSPLQEVRFAYLDCVGLAASFANRAVLRSAMPNISQILAWDRMMVPLSRLIDPLLLHQLGKTVVGVWRKRGPNPARNAPAPLTS